MEEKEIVEGVTQNEEEAVLLKEYKKLQESTVSKEKYDKDIQALKEKNELYLKAITEGEKVELSDDNSGSIQDAIADLSDFKGTNLEYWQKMTKAVDSTLKSLPENEITKMVGSEGLDEIIKVNESMKKMVEDANGDPDYFRTLYRNRVQDSAPRISSEIEKAGGIANYLDNLQRK